MSTNLNSRTMPRLLIIGLLLVALVLPCKNASATVTLAGKASYLPWSGWWWPLSRGNLVFGYNGHPSPSEKYDLYVRGSYPGSATREAQSRWFNSDANAWMGFCNGWVNASILEREEILPSSSNGVYLSVGDKKGLLTACHVDDKVIFEFCQQSPEPFHRYLLKYIGEQGEIVGADLDSTDAFWSYPIYAYSMQISEGEESDLVVCTIYFADDFVDPDYVGTKELSRTYHYKLNKSLDGSYSGSGEWLQGDEYDLHPQIIWVPISVNEEAQFVDYEIVSEMVSGVDDELENQDLVPGHHLLVVYPEETDSFTVIPQVGEKISCQLALDKQNVSSDGALYRVIKNDIVVQEGVLDSELAEFTIASQSGDDSFTLEIKPLDDNSVGVCVHLYVDVDADYVSWFYGLPSESYWFGSAAVSEGVSGATRAWIVPVASGGMPIGRGSFSGTRMFDSGRWLNVLENQQTIDYFNGDTKPLAVKMVSNQPLQSLFLVGNNNRLWGANYGDQQVDNDEKFAIPWLTSSFDMQKAVTLYLANNSLESANIGISYYRKDGKAVATVSDYILSPASVNEYEKGSYPELSGVDGWAVVDTNGYAITGKVELSEGFYRADQLPILNFARVAYLPHVADGFGWKSLLGICNPNSTSTKISLVAYLNGEQLLLTHDLEIEPFARSEFVLDGSYFGLSESQVNDVWVKVESDLEVGVYERILNEEKAAASIPLPLDGDLDNSRRLSQLALADGWWSGIVLVNPDSVPVSFELSVLNESGIVEQKKPVILGAYGKFTESIESFFKDVAVSDMATLHLDGEGVEKIKALVVYGGYDVNQLDMQLW